MRFISCSAGRKRVRLYTKLGGADEPPHTLLGLAHFLTPPPFASSSVRTLPPVPVLLSLATLMPVPPPLAKPPFAVTRGRWRERHLAALSSSNSYLRQCSTVSGLPLTSHPSQTSVRSPDQQPTSNPKFVEASPHPHPTRNPKVLASHPIEMPRPTTSSPSPV
jgi:hypothetical protein